jgi:hypothetical protein
MSDSWDNPSAYEGQEKPVTLKITLDTHMLNSPSQDAMFIAAFEDLLSFEPQRTAAIRAMKFVVAKYEEPTDE